MTTRVASEGPGHDRSPAASPVRAAAAPALVMMAVLGVTASRYGLHGDELYFRMLPVAWWYDDQPPLTVWLSRSAAAVSEAAWVQRLPAIVAAGAGVLLAAAFPWALGYGRSVQRVAAWAHATTVYPLLVGHVFLTASIDLVAWQAVILLAVVAVRGRSWALTWAGVVAGLACWNKLLVVVIVGALLAAVLVCAPRVLRTRHTLVAGAAFVVIAGPQLGAQLLHGMPMSQVSGDLLARQGSLNRWLVVPLLLAFVGPPFAAVVWRGLHWRSGESSAAPEGRAAGSRPVLGVAAGLVLVWTLMFPAQPYYAVAAFLPALAVGWGLARDDGADVWRRARGVIAANAAVAVALSLPVFPAGSWAYRMVSTANPVARDQAGWAGYVDQVSRVAREHGGPNTGVLTQTYSLAGAVAFHGPDRGIPRGRVASGHNALWSLGPPQTERVILVGDVAATHRRYFRSCTDAGVLRLTESDPFDTAGSPMAVCDGPVGGWAAVWPAFRHLGA